MKSKEYWKDYKAVDVLGADGKVKKELQYFGDLYVYNGEKSALKKARRLMAMLSCLADACFIAAATRAIAANSAGPVSACGLISVIPMFFMTLGAVKSLFAPEKLSKNDFRETNLYSKAGAVVSAVLGAANAFLRILHFTFFTDRSAAAGYWTAIALFALCGEISLEVYKMTVKQSFTVIPGSGVDE